MAKALYRTKGGAEVVIEGTPEEVADLLARLELPSGSKPKRLPKASKASRQGARFALADLVRGLIEQGFFKKPKEIGEIKAALETQGHIYPVTSLSPLLLRLVQKRELRRLKEKKQWVYVS